MEIDWIRIEQSSTTFRGIIPSWEARCAGKITLDVVFGTPDNYSSEEITFQGAPFSSGYHTLLGREAFTIFQAIPHYGYMKLKMSGPNRIITLANDPDIALRAKNKTAALALEALSEALAAEELTVLRSTVNRDDVILDKRSKSTPFKPADENSQIPSPPNGPCKNSLHRGIVKPRHGRRTTRVPARELGHIRLASLRHAMNPTQARRA